MKRNSAHETGEAGERIFQDMLPSSWVKRKQCPDYGIDHLVELAEKGELTGEEFAAQVKGTKRVRIAKETIRFSLEVKDLVYYVDKRLQPVYLVVIDLTNRRGYFLFLQEYAVEKLKGRDWRKQKTISVRIPRKNRLRDKDRFIADVRASLKYVKNLHPGDIAAAIDAEKQRLEGLDPRFGVEISINRGERNYALMPKEPVPFKLMFRVPKEESSDKYESLIAKGLPVQFGPGEIKAQGLPILEGRLRDGVTIQLAKRESASLAVRVFDERGVAQKGLFGIIGEMEGGRSECRFKGELADCPLIFTLTCSFAKDFSQKEGRVDIAWHPDRWLGFPINRLPHFDAVASIINVLGGNGRFNIELNLAGMQAVSHHEFEKPPPIAERMQAVIDLLHKARRVGQILGKEFVLKEWGTRSDIGYLNLLYELLVIGEYKTRASGKRFTVSLVTADRSV